MTPSEAIAALDRQLAEHGEDVLHRRFGAPDEDGERAETDTPMRAFVRPVKAEDMIGDIKMTASKVTLSATGFLTLWPFEDGDALVIAGRVHSLRVPPPIRVNGAIVRLNLVAES